MHDHEWIYFKNLINQNIGNTTIQKSLYTFLKRFNVNNIEFTKENLKKYALKIKSISLNGPHAASALVQNIYTANKSNFQTNTTETKLVIDLLEHISEKLEHKEHDFSNLNK